MKITTKYQLGGFIDSVDSSLDKLGTWGKFGVQLLDPTGITSWKDISTALKDFQKTGGLKEAGSLALAGLGAIPAFGTFAKLGKLGKLDFLKSFPKLNEVVTKTSKVIDSNKLIKKASDLPKAINIDTYKKLIDPSTSASEAASFLKDLDLEDLTKLKSCVESSAMQYVESVGKAIKSPEQAVKMEKYESLLSTIDKQKHRLSMDELYSEPEAIIATTNHAYDVTNNGAVTWGRSSYSTTKADTEKASKAAKNRKKYDSENSEVYFK